MTDCAAQKWIVGKQYPVVQGELYYMAIRSEEKLTELMEWQVQSPRISALLALAPVSLFTIAGAHGRADAPRRPA